jgi:hypothetical protein
MLFCYVSHHGKAKEQIFFAKIETSLSNSLYFACCNSTLYCHSRPKYLNSPKDCDEFSFSRKDIIMVFIICFKRFHEGKEVLEFCHKTTVDTEVRAQTSYAGNEGS